MITLDLPWPPSGNNLFPLRRGKRVPSPEYRVYRARVMHDVWKHFGRRPEPITEPVEVEVLAHRPDKRRRDLALKATPGPWTEIGPDDEPYGDIRILTATGSIARLWQDDAPVPEYNEQQWANAAYIAAVDPSTVLRLLERLEAAEALIQHLMVCAYCAESSPERCDEGAPLLSAYRSAFDNAKGSEG